MNTQPDETLITQWIDGELSGEELAHMEAYASKNPELLALRAQSHALSSDLKQLASDDIPYADFFTTQVMRKVERESAVPAVGPEKSSFRESLSRWLLPAAFAMMAVSFYLGTQLQTTGNSVKTVNNAEVYTADSRVEARLVSGEGDSPTVIVLTGWESESDALDLVEHSEFDASAIAARHRRVDSVLGASLSF